MTSPLTGHTNARPAPAKNWVRRPRSFSNSGATPFDGGEITLVGKAAVKRPGAWRKFSKIMECLEPFPCGAVRNRGSVEFNSRTQNSGRDGRLNTAVLRSVKEAMAGRFNSRGERFSLATERRHVLCDHGSLTSPELDARALGGIYPPGYAVRGSRLFHCPSSSAKLKGDISESTHFVTPSSRFETSNGGEFFCRNIPARFRKGPATC